MNQGSGSTGYNGKVKRHAQKLRKNATAEENKLWYQFLREYPIQFKRQRPIAGYIADFYCPQAKLVIELDGGQHFTEEGLNYDQARTEIIELYRIQVIRFTNKEVRENFQGVCIIIDQQVKMRLNMA